MHPRKTLLQPPKPFKSYAELVVILQQRGMIVNDPQRAERKLAQVGYYRMSGFWYPCRVISFDDSGKAKVCPHSHMPIRDDSFLPDTSFEEVFDLYLFDKKLRLAVLDALERIEVFFRSIIAHQLGYKDPLAYIKDEYIHPKCRADFTDRRTGHPRNRWIEWQNQLKMKIEKSQDDCIVWHRKRNMAIPFWVVIEAWDFGTMSRYYEMLVGSYQNRISRMVGCKTPKELIGWLKELNTLRNRCAHHSRIWNRKCSNPLSVSSADRLNELGLDELAYTRLYGQLAVLWHLVTTIGPSSTWIEQVADIIDTKPLLPNCNFSSMGFPSETGFPRQIFQ